MQEKQLILLAEDDKFIAKAYKDGLTRAGFNLEVASDGGEAIEKIKTLQPDLILLDLIMPIKNGFEVLEEIKGNKKTKNTPVIIVSNLGQDADVDKAIQLGAADYLIKSNYSLKEIVDKVKHYL